MEVSSVCVSIQRDTNPQAKNSSSRRISCSLFLIIVFLKLGEEV